MKRLMKMLGYALAGVVLAGGAVWLGEDGAAAPRSQAGGVADVDQARQQLDALEVAPEHTATEYDREDWSHWDPVGEGCDAREWVLRESAEDMVRTKGSCTIGDGRWTSSYDGEVVTDPSDLDIDHMVPLGEAHASGGYAWTDEERTEFANDVRYLLPVSATSNRSKGDADPAEWLPDIDVCGYVALYVEAKAEYALTVDQAEHDAIERELDRC